MLFRSFAASSRDVVANSVAQSLFMSHRVLNVRSDYFRAIILEQEHDVHDALEGKAGKYERGLPPVLTCLVQHRGNKFVEPC